MPTWTEQQLNDYLAKQRNQAGDKGVCSDNPQSIKRNTLECVAPRKDPRRTGPVERFRIRYTVFSVRPCDWDGYSIKELQDMLVKASILSGDDWRILEGCVISEKAYSKEEERTEIIIERLWTL